MPSRTTRAARYLGLLICPLALPWPGCTRPEHLQDIGAAPPVQCVAPAGHVHGRLEGNSRWCGEVLVDGNVVVPPGATLTIDPGTVVRFSAYRGYRAPGKRLRLRVEGKLLATGKPGRLIRFTSSHGTPLNGDWSMVELVGARGSQVSRAVFEFSRHGLNVRNTDLALHHVVFRFNNREGLYIEDRSRVVLSNSRVHANGYSCITLKQHSHLTVRSSYIANCGTVGLRVDASDALLQGNLVEGCQEAVFLDNDARVTLHANRLAGQKTAGVSCGEGRNRVLLGNNVFDGYPLKLAVACKDSQVQEQKIALAPPLTLITGLSEDNSRFLDYIPGDRRHDRYRYVYPPLDQTRKVLRRIGGGLGLTWSLTWDGTALWTANLDGKVLRLDPQNGKVLRSIPAPGPQPRGLAWDGTRLWINDFSRRQIFALDPVSGKVLRQFAAPDPVSGCMGLAWDGEHLHALGWATHRLYKLSPGGKVISSVAVPWRDIGGGVRVHVAGGLTWDGKTFWAPADRLVRFGACGRVIGWLHSTSDRVWDMAWDGEALWTTQRTNEGWTRIPRLMRVGILAQQKSWKGSQRWAAAQQ